VTRRKGAAPPAAATESVLVAFTGEYSGCQFTFMSSAPIPSSPSAAIASEYKGLFTKESLSIVLTPNTPEGLATLTLLRNGAVAGTARPAGWNC
jgi:hypothetical protein